MKRKILIIENNFEHFEIISRIFPDDIRFPKINATENQSFMTDIICFLLNSTKASEKALQMLIGERLGDSPDFILLDWGLLTPKDDDQSGLIFKTNFIDLHFQTSTVFSITGSMENHTRDEQDARHYIISKYKEGDRPEEIKKEPGKIF